MMSWKDRWWYTKYRWHRWRAERASIALSTHITIIGDHLGVDLDKVQIKRVTVTSEES